MKYIQYLKKITFKKGLSITIVIILVLIIMTILKQFFYNNFYSNKSKCVSYKIDNNPYIINEIEDELISYSKSNMKKELTLNYVIYEFYPIDSKENNIATFYFSNNAEENIYIYYTIVDLKEKNIVELGEKYGKQLSLSYGKLNHYKNEDILKMYQNYIMTHDFEFENDKVLYITITDNNIFQVLD